jgi:Ca2+-binding EF-hand superfamily protein
MATPKVKREPLIDDDTDDFTPKCVAALEEIFQRFDVDKDGVLNEKELDEFAKACNGTPFDEDSKTEIKTYFDTTDKGDLTLKG